MSESILVPEAGYAAPDESRGGAIDAAGKWVGDPVSGYHTGAPAASPVASAESHFIIERHGPGWRITVRRRGYLPRVIDAATRAEVNRLRMRLTDDGLRGIVVGAALDDRLPLSGD